MHYTTRLFHLLLATIAALLLINCGGSSGNSPSDNNAPAAVIHDQQDSSSSSSQGSDEPDMGTVPHTGTCQFDLTQRQVADELTGFRVEGNKLLDCNYNDVIKRGLFYHYTSYSIH